MNIPKNIKIKTNPDKKNKKNITKKLCQKKIQYYKSIIQNSILYVQKYKILDILDAGELNLCVNNLEKIFNDCINIEQALTHKKTKNYEQLIDKLQIINDDLSINIKSYGTKNIEDLLTIVFGNNYLKTEITPENKDLFNIIKKYLHPTSFKLLDWKIYKGSGVKKPIVKNKIIEDFSLAESAKTLDCFDLARTTKKFQSKVYGIKICFQNSEKKKILIASCIADDMLIDCIESKFIKDKIKNLKENKPKDDTFMNDDFTRFVNSLTIKELLIYNEKELYHKFAGYLSQTNLIKKKTISQVIKEFISDDLYQQRKTLILLLIKNNDPEFQYLAYLLYDLLSTENGNSYDTLDQTILFDSLSWPIKKYFRDAMKTTIKYTKNLANFDINKIPIEQQICLMKADDKVKEKAMLKLKEVKAKSEDSGSKARQYLDGLLKIPFGVFRNEKILSLMNDINTEFHDLITSIKEKDNTVKIEIKNSYSYIEIKNYIKYLREEYCIKRKQKFVKQLIKYLTNGKKDNLVYNISQINNIIKKLKLKKYKIKYSGKKNNEIKIDISKFLYKTLDNDILFENIMKKYNSKIDFNSVCIKNETKSLEDKWEDINTSFTDIHDCLDKSIYGHTKAKRQIERVIGQWITGKQRGYCFGFEGPPGVGKCHKKGTPIMLSNGKIEKVENIKVGDQIMGDDSTARNILALGCGKEKMYEIRPTKGDSYVVNKSHILSLKLSKTGRKGDKHQTILGRRYYKNDIVDICIEDYLSLPIYLKECLKGYRVGVDFPKSKVELDPYILGYWLGDGTSSGPEITTIEPSVLEYFSYYCEEYGLKLKPVGNTIITYRMSFGKKNRIGFQGCTGKNPILNMMKKYNLMNNKHIPHVYKCNSKDIRLELLAGIIDSDGSLQHGGYDIIQKNEELLDDIIFLARSLGFAAYKTECKKSCIYKGIKKEETYYRTYIHGEGIEYIPVKVERKKTNKRKQIKNVLNVGIKVIPLKEDEYYGFQIDGNSRFLLGDFTVTHNTSLARKGLANCLKDHDGTSRPFSFIALGGSSNASTLSGHNYTYVGSTWGRVVDILMESKCMNPIIFIDELDKVSRTENGKEIIGILTHLIDPTQNESFQDKYFSGIDIDMSKVLFIFSYNDVSIIDRILLDRIHRVKFDNLTLQDKLEICHNYILPELFENIGFKNIIKFSDDILTFIIDNYTQEAGVRKLKELLFEIISEINLEILNNEQNYEIPIEINEDDITKKFFKEKYKKNPKKIHEKSKIGIMNGLWANSMGMGGIIPIETYFFPSSTFLDLKLTGLQGDVMKESMNVAKTLAWKLTDDERKVKLLEKFEKDKLQGIHIHCPEGAVPKDGPSAGTAITVAIYSLLNNKEIKNTVAITGEMNLQGKVTAIGGLELKILGGIKAGITHFIFPKENEKQYDLFLEKYKDKNVIPEGITFTIVEDINDVLDIVYI